MAELLAAVNMSAYARAYPHTLSGGEQQRVALARALAPEPELMLLDEAFSALDTSLRAQVREETLALLRDAGTPTLLVTHDAEEAIRVGDRIHAMLAGRIVQSGTPSELYAAPVNALRRRLLRPGEPVSRPRARGARSRRRWAGASAKGFSEGSRGRGDRAAGGAARCAGQPAAGLRAQVLVRRDLGPVHLLRLRLADGSSVKVRQAGQTDAAVGDEVEIELDPRHLFVYPAAGLTVRALPSPAIFATSLAAGGGQGRRGPAGSGR